MDRSEPSGNGHKPSRGSGVHNQDELLAHASEFFGIKLTQGAQEPEIVPRGSEVDIKGAQAGKKLFDPLPEGGLNISHILEGKITPVTNLADDVTVLQSHTLPLHPLCGVLIFLDPYTRCGT